MFNNENNPVSLDAMIAKSEGASNHIKVFELFSFYQA